MPTLIDTSGLTKIGDMPSGGGLPAAINPSDGGSTGYKQATIGWGGVTLSAPAAIHSADVTSATNGFDASGLTTPITLQLWAKQGAAPANGTDGTLIGSVGPFTDVNATTVKTIASNNTTTEWDHVWVRGTTGVWFVSEAMKFWGADGGPPQTQSQQTAGLITEYATEYLLTTTLPITTGPYPNLTPKQILRLNVGAIGAGDLIRCHAEAEFTNAYGYPVSVVSQVSIAKHSTFGQVITDIQVHKFDRTASADAYKICKSNGPNVDNNIVHHSPHFRSGEILVSPEMEAAFNGEDAWVIFWAWAASTGAGSGHTIAVGDDETGGMIVTKRGYA